MTRELRAVEPGGVWAAVRLALAGDGPAVLPVAAGSPDHGSLPDVDLGVAAVVETSGSTGRPKRIVLGRDALLASAAASESALGGPGEWLLALPTHYIAGLNVLVRSITSGTTPVAIEPGPFTPRAFVTAAHRMSHPARFVSLVPAQLSRLLDDADATDAVRGFERVLVGGQSIGGALQARALAAGVRVTATYGSSETSGGCVYDGRPIGAAEVSVDGGEVLLAGPTLADGYLADPDRTAASFVVRDGQRWYRTGDAGEVVDGVLRVTGRFDDVIISGGEKISIGAVERVVHELPQLEDAVVVGVASEQWGEVPVVFTTMPVDSDAVRAAVVLRLGRAAAPARVIVVDRMPLLASGKPDRAQLAASVSR